MTCLRTIISRGRWSLNGHSTVDVVVELLAKGTASFSGSMVLWISGSMFYCLEYYHMCKLLLDSSTYIVVGIRTSSQKIIYVPMVHLNTRT